MRGRFLTFTALGAAALILGLTSGGTAPAAVTTLYADVGPGFTITLKDAAGAAVTTLTPGTYSIVVNDQAADHNFHLTGAGGVDLSTTVPFVGQVTWTVDLVAGSYHFVCDPHADGMFGDFTVAAADTTPPDTSIGTGPTGSVNSTSASFSFSSTEPGSTFECALDTAAFAACTSPKAYSALTNGTHTFQVRATDAAGNVDASPASSAWTVDTIPPDTTITAGPAGTVGSTSSTFGFSSNDATASFQCALDSTTAYSACTSPKSYSGLVSGAHTFRVRGVDAAGNLDATPASRSWSIDVTPPETTITVAPSSVVASGDASFEFASEPGAAFECALDGAPYAACGSPQLHSGLADGDHTFQVRAVDAAGNLDPTPASVSWTIDTTPPETAIDAGPSASVNIGTASFTFSASEPGASFECSLDGQPFGPCSSPQDYLALSEGAHSFDVRATDAAGNLDTTPASASWTIDTAAPETTIDSGPAATVGQTTATFAFSAGEPGSSFECALDGAAFGACSSPQVYPGLAQGPHTFQVRATDAAGNTDATPASSTWTINSTALYATDGPGFTISLTDAAGAPITQLAQGTYTIVVHDESAVHNFHLTGPGVDLSTTVPFVGEVIWTVTVTAGAYHYQCDPHLGMSGDFTVPDTTPPDTTITSGPSGAVASSAASFEFSASEADASLECSLDGAPFAPCSSPQGYSGLADGVRTFEVRAIDAAGNADPTPASRGWTVDTTAPETTITAQPRDPSNRTSASFSFSSSEVGSSFECSLDGAVFAACSSPQGHTGLANGTHTFQVRAADAVGHVDPTPASRMWTVDTVAPDTTITAGPAGTVNSASAGFSFSSSEAGSRFQCSLDGAAYAACTSPRSYTALSNGSHSFRVRALDAAGNADPTAASRTWSVDTAPPDTTITAGPAGWANSASVGFSFSSSEGASSFQCSLDGAAYAACSSPQSYLGLVDGDHSFAVRATDGAANADPTPAMRTWTVDTVPPDTTITAGPAGAVASSSASFGFVSSEAGASFECSLDGASFAPCSSPQSYLDLVDGDHSFAVRAIDAAANADPTPARRTWTVNAAPPDTTITAGPAGTVASSSASFEFVASEAGVSFECSLDGAPFTPCSSPQSYGALADGDHTFAVRATEPAGNADPSPASSTWTIDTTPAETAIDAGPAGTLASTSADFEFSANEPDLSFECALDGEPFAPCSSPQSYPGPLADGIHTFAVRAVDAAGNADPTPAGRTWTVEAAPPETTITAGSSGTVASSSASLEFSANEVGASFECAFDGAAFSACSSPQAYTGLTDGAHAFQVRAIDAAGKVDPTPAGRGWTVDTTAPETTITAGPIGTVASDSAAFEFSATETGSSFRCSLDGSAFSDCTSPMSYAGLAAGQHAFEVQAIDPVGNADPTPASRTWTVDTAPPAMLYGKVGPGSTISLEDASGTIVTHLEPGTYTVVVRDRSQTHAFHLRGPGVDWTTPVVRIVDATWTVTFVNGKYRYRSDRHKEVLRGKFIVGAVVDEDDEDNEEGDN